MQILNRIKLLNLYHRAGCGHIGCSLSCLDIVHAIMTVKHENERMILSKGHAAGALYTILHTVGEISDDVLSTFYADGTKLAAHPTASSFDNIPFGLGSLGHGFPIGCGISISHKRSGREDMTYVLMSDGETNEGTTWEAAHFAVLHGLDNLIVVIDKNGLQGFGRTSEVLGDTADARKWAEMGFAVYERDGHDLDALTDTFVQLRNIRDQRPKLLIAHTVKGKGVPFMEDRLEWHYRPMTQELFESAIDHLNRQLP
jgi:transketolase